MADDNNVVKLTKEDLKLLQTYKSELSSMTDERLKKEQELADLRASAARNELLAATKDEKAQQRQLQQADALLGKEAELLELKRQGLDTSEEFRKLQKVVEAEQNQNFSAAQKRYLQQRRAQNAALDLEKQRTKELEQQQKIYDSLNEIGQSISGINFKNFAGFGGFAAAAMDMAHALDAANVALAQSTGYTRALAPEMAELAANNFDLGVSLSVAGEVIAGLNSSMTTFGALTSDTRHVIEDFAIQLNNMGVSGEQFGRTLDILTRGMGMTAPGAAALSKDFDRLAQSLGLPTSQLIEDFNELGPELVSFGKQGRAIFRDLAREARSLGISTKSAFDLATTFDTFEQGAELAGKLNAQLGTQINNLELMMTDNLADRVKLLRREFSTMGKSFEQMSRYERLAVARILGQPVDEVAKLFSNPVAFQRFQKEQKEMRARAEQMSSAMDKFKAAVESLFLSMEPLLTILIKFANYLAGSYIPQVIIVGMLFKTLLIPAFKALLLGAAKFLPFLTGMATKLGLIAVQSPAAAAGVGTFGQIAAVSTVKVLALGKAMLYVGVAFGAMMAGLGVAATGVAQLVKSFKGLGDESVYALLGLTLFTVGMIAFAAILVYAAPLLGGASTGLFIFAGGLVAVGAGIGLIAAGFGYMVKSVANVISIIGAGVMGNAIDGVVSLTGALKDLGSTIIGLEENNSLDTLGLAVNQLVRLEPLAKEGPGGAEFFNALSRTIEVTAKLTSSEVANLDAVTNQMIRVSGEVNAGNTSRLDAIAAGVGALGNRKETTIPVKLMLKNKVLGDAIIKYVSEAAGNP